MLKKLLIFLLLPFLFFGQADKKIHYFKSFDGVKIAFSDEGKGEPVLLIHGFISNGSSWDRTALKSDLLKSGYRVIVPDLRGNGNSDKPQTPESYENNAEIKDLIALANHLKLEAYDAVGYSRGSIVLAKLLTVDARITKAVLGGIGLDFSNPNWDRRILFADAFSGRAELTSKTSGAVYYAKSVGADIKVLGFLQDYQPVTSVEELRKVSLKTLVIAGDLDVGNGAPSDLQQALPNSELIIVSGDHDNAYKGEEFSEAVLNFLSTKIKSKY